MQYASAKKYQRLAGISTNQVHPYSVHKTSVTCACIGCTWCVTKCSIHGTAITTAGTRHACIDTYTHKSTYLTSKANARMPAARGAEALVPV